MIAAVARSRAAAAPARRLAARVEPFEYGPTPMPPRANDDGVRIVPVSDGRRLRWMIAAAVVVPIVVTIVAVVLIRASPATSPHADSASEIAEVANADPPHAVARRIPTAPAASPGARAVTPRRVAAEPVKDVAGLGASPKPEPERSPTRELDAGDAILALREEGIHTGIAAFGLPGTSPPKSGIIVPEDFDLPEGYVRHYQSTDDGQQLPAILMFHPDYEFLNDRGEVVPVPDDRVVTPDMAPPGLPVQMLEVPERKVGEPVH